MEYDVDQAVEILSRTPGILRAWLTGLPDTWLRGNEGGETWNPFDIVGHLIHGEETDWIPRAKITLSWDAERKFEPFDRFAQFEKSKGKSLQALLDEFATLRKVSIATLKAWDLDEEAMDRTAVHPALGQVTLRQLLSAWVVHDLGHLAQIGRAMASQYRDEVGPWISHLPVLEVPVTVEAMRVTEGQVCEAILRSLPQWFADEPTIAAYRKDIDGMPTLVARRRGEIVGFLTLRPDNDRAAEIQVMAVRPEHHRLGIGRLLVEKAEERLRNVGVEYLQVKTVGPSRPSLEYDMTRDFYLAMGFRPLEEFDNLWPPPNPCLILVKKI